MSRSLISTITYSWYNQEYRAAKGEFAVVVYEQGPGYSKSVATFETEEEMRKRYPEARHAGEGID